MIFARAWLLVILKRVIEGVLPILDKPLNFNYISRGARIWHSLGIIGFLELYKLFAFLG